MFTVAADFLLPVGHSLPEAVEMDVVAGPGAEGVVRIFELHAEGHGQARIAKILNEASAPAPRAQRGRPCGWSPSSIHEVLYRPLYRGRIVWNRSRKRDQWGQKRQEARPEAEWVDVDAPELRIVP